MSEATKALIHEITEEIWNGRHLVRIPEFFSEACVADYRPYAPPRTGHDAIRGMVERAWIAFPDYHEELHEVLADGDQAAARITISGTQLGQWGVLPPTGRHVEFDEIIVFQVQNGRVVHQRGIADNLTALRQLGVLPIPPS